MAERAWVFAYGSLADPASAAETLGDRTGRRAVPATLEGWRRGFTQARDNRRCEKTFALPDGGLPAHVLGLNVHPDEEERVSGVAIEVTGAELARLDGRELRYDRDDVTARVLAVEPLGGTVHVFRAKPEHLALEPPPGAVILRSYLEAVEAAFAALGADALAELRRSIHPLPAPVVEGRLVGGEIPPGNPRAW